VTGRIGFTPDNSWLYYVKGGWASGNIRSRAHDTVGPPTFAFLHNSFDSNWHDGWTAGIGIERKLANNWILGVAYDYVKFDTDLHSGGVSGTPAPPLTYNHDVKAHMSVVTVRLSHLFSWWGR
jgi:outer membrane immunogenic protein